MKLKIYILFIFGFFLGDAYSQPLLEWKAIDSLNSKLPPGISIYKASGSINGDTVTAFYSITDIINHDLVFYPLYSETNQKPEKYFEESPEDIVLLTNGGYFGTNVSYSLVLNNYQTLAPNIRAVNRSHNNTNYAYYPTRSAFGVNSMLQSEAAYVYTFSNNNITYSYPEPSLNTTEELPLPQPTSDFPEGGMPWGVSEAIGGGPMLIRDSIINYNYTPELFPDDITASIAPRTAIGVNGKGEIINLVVDGRQDHSRGVSLEVLSRILLEIGCVEAINLDGGGSSAMLVYDEVVNEPSDGNTRYIPSAVSIKKARLITNASKDFAIRQNPVDSLDEGSFRKPETLIFGNGDIGTYFFNDILPAEYRLEFYHNNKSTLFYTEDLEFILYTGGEARDTIRVNQNLQNLDHFISLGNYQLGPSDSLVIANKSTTGFAHVDVLRLIKTGSGLPEIDIVSGNYYGDHSPGETVKFSIEARAVNVSRKISGFRIYEVIEDEYKLLNDKSFSPASYYRDSVDYLITEDPDQIRLKAVVYDEVNDSSYVYYTINIDNTPPSVALGKNSILQGGTGDTLSFELKLLPANDLRPLDELRIYKNPATQNLLLDRMTPDPEGDTVYFNYQLMAEDAPAVNFRFILSDQYGYEAYRDYSYFFSSVNNSGAPVLHAFYNPLSNELIIQSDKTIAAGKIRIYFYDISGRLMKQEKIFHTGQSAFSLNEIPPGAVLTKIHYGNSVYHYRFIQHF